MFKIAYSQRFPAKPTSKEFTHVRLDLNVALQNLKFSTQHKANFLDFHNTLGLHGNPVVILKSREFDTWISSI